LIHFPIISDPRGNLTFIESNNHIPFTIQRVFWIYDVPGGETRGGHAYTTNEEIIIALSGSFDVITLENDETTRHTLNRSYSGMYVPPLTWRHLENFSTNALALIISSNFFSEEDYIREKKLISSERKKISNTKQKTFIQSKVNQVKLDSKKTTIEDCNSINIGVIHKEKGNITVLENLKNIPFKIERIYYLYDVPGGEERGGHAHKKLRQFIVAAMGSFDVIIDDGQSKKTIQLNRSFNCLEIVPGIWRELVNFSSGSICLVMASHSYDETDYFRNYSHYQKYKSDD